MKTSVEKNQEKSSKLSDGTKTNGKEKKAKQKSGQQHQKQNRVCGTLQNN